MIEPQNTMLPFTPQSNTKELPSGEMGFGEMLAHTLGMVPRFDPSAIAGLLPDQGQESAAGNGDTTLREGDTTDDDLWSAASAIPFVNQRQMSSEPRPPSDAVLVEQPGAAVDPIRNGGGLVAAQPVAAAGGDIAPPVLDSATVASAQESEIVDDTAAPERSLILTPVDKSPVVVDPKPEPPSSDLGPVPNPSDDQLIPILADTAPVTAPRRADPGSLTPVAAGPVDAVPSPAVPTPPVALEAPAAHARRENADAAATPIRIQGESISLTDSGRISLQERRVDLEPGTPAPQMAGPSLSPENVTGRPAPVSSFTNQAAPAQHTALAERVLEAVELQANQPPPRTMIVDIPEIEGLRLVVSVRSGAEVHVVPSSSSTATGTLQGFMNELDGVLAERGFVMTGDGRRRGGNPEPEDQRDLPRRPRPAVNRPTDNDLRI